MDPQLNCGHGNERPGHPVGVGPGSDGEWQRCDGPGREQLPGVCTGLKRLADEGEQAASRRKSNDQAGSAQGGACDARGASCKKRCADEGELAGASNRVPVGRNREDHAEGDEGRRYGEGGRLEPGLSVPTMEVRAYLGGHGP